MKAYIFGVRYDNGELSHTGDAQEIDVSDLAESAKESLMSGKLVRLDDPITPSVYYYHLEKTPIEQVYLGFWLATNYGFFFEDMKKHYSGLSNDNTV